MENKDDIYSTRDLYLASTLVCLKFNLVGLDFQIDAAKDRPIGYFKFPNSPSLQEARMKYTQGLLSVEPKNFVTVMHGLKAEVENAYKNPHLEQKRQLE